MGYPFNLVFTRLFTSGSLSGLTHDDNLPCMTRKACTDWVESINRQNTQGKLNYKVVSYTIETK